MRFLLLLPFIIGVFSSSLVFAAGETEENIELSARQLRVRGMIYYKGFVAPGVTVNLYDGNELVHSKKSGILGGFDVSLKMNRRYMLEMVRDGLVTKRIAFYTHLPNSVKELNDYIFDVEMFELQTKKDLSDLDFPVGLIYFNVGMNMFWDDLSYSNEMRKLQEELLGKR